MHVPPGEARPRRCCQHLCAGDRRLCVRVGRRCRLGAPSDGDGASRAPPLTNVEHGRQNARVAATAAAGFDECGERVSAEPDRRHGAASADRLRAAGPRDEDLRGGGKCCARECDGGGRAAAQRGAGGPCCCAASASAVAGRSLLSRRPLLHVARQCRGQRRAPGHRKPPSARGPRGVRTLVISSGDRLFGAELRGNPREQLALSARTRPHPVTKLAIVAVIVSGRAQKIALQRNEPLASGLGVRGVSPFFWQ